MLSVTLTASDSLKKLGDTVALGELARVVDSASTDEPEQHAECIDVNTAVVLTRDKFWSHVQRRADHTPRHHCCRLAETEVCKFSAILEVQL